MHAHPPIRLGRHLRDRAVHPIARRPVVLQLRGRPAEPLQPGRERERWGEHARFGSGRRQAPASFHVSIPARARSRSVHLLRTRAARERPGLLPPRDRDAQVDRHGGRGVPELASSSADRPVRQASAGPPLRDAVRAGGVTYQFTKGLVLKRWIPVVVSAAAALSIPATVTAAPGACQIPTKADFTKVFGQVTLRPKGPNGCDVRTAKYGHFVSYLNPTAAS